MKVEEPTRPSFDSSLRRMMGIPKRVIKTVGRTVETLARLRKAENL